MKKNLFKLSWLLAIAVFISFTSCDDDDGNNGTNPPTVEDGIYVKGEGTALAELDFKGIMKTTRNEVVQEDRAELKEIYIAVKGGAAGFNIVEVSGATEVTYGPGADFAKIAEADLNQDEPRNGLWKGTYTESATAFTVEEDGLYHVTIDTELKKASVAKVVWGVIGAATPNGWGGSTELSATFDLNEMAFEATEVKLAKGDFKFRFSNGWKILLDTDYDLGDGKKGINVNTNFGGAVDALVAGGDNMTNSEVGYYTINMTWKLDGGTTATLTKTGEVEAIDYTNTELGLIGSYIEIGTEKSEGWNMGIGLTKPTVSNTTDYVWAWDEVLFMADSTFKIREGDNWDGKSVGFGDVTMAGSAASKFSGNGDGNFVPSEDGTYKVAFKIDAATETYTFTIDAITK